MLRNISSTVVVLVAVLIVGCSNGGETTPQSSPNPATVGAADLSGLDATETESEIIRLLRDGYSMYTRTHVFDGIIGPSPTCTSFNPQFVCDTYPRIVVDESWATTDPDGLSTTSFRRRSTEDGTVLATAVQGEWTDLASGEKWSSGNSPGSDMIEFIQGMFTKIEREEARGLEQVGGKILGRPSVVFPDGEFEYQVANPLVQRTTRWQDDGNGGRELVSEFRVLEFAMLPADALPDFAASAGSSS